MYMGGAQLLPPIFNDPASSNHNMWLSRQFLTYILPNSLCKMRLYQPGRNVALLLSPPERPNPKRRREEKVVMTGHPGQ